MQKELVLRIHGVRLSFRDGKKLVVKLVEPVIEKWTQLYDKQSSHEDSQCGHILLLTLLSQLLWLLSFHQHQTTEQH